jgi:hypothetical protein
MYVWEAIATSVGRGTRGWLVSSPVAALALVPLAGNWSAASRSRHHATSTMAADLLNSVEPYGVLITRGDNDTFPLWYAQEVEGVRRDVVVVCTSLLGTDWYARQIIRRPIYEYDVAKGPAIYRNGAWAKPTSSPLRMTFAEADAIPEAYDIRQPVAFNAHDLHAVIDPRQLEYGALLRSDALVLRMIADSWPERPIYFARSDIGYPRQLGLQNFVLAQGLAAKVFIPPANPVKDTVFVEGDGWFDAARTRALWKEFGGPKSIVDEGQWIDRPSASIAGLYIFGGIELAEALRAKGSTAEAQDVFAKTRQVAHTVRLDNYLGGAESVFAAPHDSGSAIPLKVDAGTAPTVKNSEVSKKKR